jgi:hypothetical protein
MRWRDNSNIDVNSRGFEAGGREAAEYMYSTFCPHSIVQMFNHYYISLFRVIAEPNQGLREERSC